jgi:antitoxin component YwqK of YwqJK toxin-antitoxin module
MRLITLCTATSAAIFLTACQQHLPPECIEKSYIHRYGVVVEPDYWNNAGRNGQVVSTLRDGAVLTQTFNNGILHGESCCTFPHSSQLQKREMFAHDQLVSCTTYSLDGLPLQTTNYTTPESWTVTTWYEHGQPSSIERFDRNMLIDGEYYNMRNEKDSWISNGNGDRYTRDRHGFLISVDSFRSGELAYSTTYHPNGVPKEITPYAGGKIHGDRKTYYPGGEPQSIEPWHFDRQQGTTVLFQNGERFAEVPYLAGKKSGIERRFRDGSIVTQEISWHDDKMHGPTYTYVGDSFQTDWFYRGRLTSRSNFESYSPKCKKPMSSQQP